jgi:hypothetical protein
MRAFSLLGTVLLMACGGGIRVVVVDDEGGLLELSGDESAAHQAAEAHMREHCGADGYRVVFDGTSSVATREGYAPSASESARRMALPSDLPGAVEPSGTEPTGGSSIDDSGRIHVADPSDGAREERVSYERRRRLEYECEREEVDEEAEGEAAAAGR